MKYIDSATSAVARETMEAVPSLGQGSTCVRGLSKENRCEIEDEARYAQPAAAWKARDRATAKMYLARRLFCPASPCRYPVTISKAVLSTKHQIPVVSVLIGIRPKK
jgi:hypothetical protein